MRNTLPQDFEKLFGQRALGCGCRPSKDHIGFENWIKWKKRDFIVRPGDAVNADGIAAGTNDKRGVVEQVVAPNDVQPLKGIVEPARHLILNEPLFGTINRQIKQIGRAHGNLSGQRSVSPRENAPAVLLRQLDVFKAG